VNEVILFSLIALGGVAVVFAVIIFFVDLKFKVIEDPKIDEVQAQLPGANCGGCGYPGCRGFAEAVVKAGNMDSLFCPVGGNELLKAVAPILGIVAVEREPQVAVVRCSGSIEKASKKLIFDGPQSCAFAHSLFAGDTGCPYGCLGLGDCVTSCTFDAIYVDAKTGLPVVDEVKCTSCGACVKACPRTIIELRNKGKKSRRIYVSCINKEKGAVAKKNCEVACIGCGKCVKSCTFEAIKMENNIAYIDYEKCKLCRKCASECPTGAILELNFPPRKTESAAKAETEETPVQS
jgi:Na+-translocating ferredoxin:NAD+ oxidoreductase RNF subunit RnfB